MSSPISVAGLSYPHEGRENGVTYYYAVTALSEFRESEKSKELAATPQSPPAAPRNVRAVLVDGVATVAWNVVSNSGHYTVYMASVPSVGPTTFTTFADGQKQATDNTALAFGNLDETKTYHFTVTAANVGGEGTESVAASAAPVTVAIATGANHSCAIKLDRTLECWGANNYGQLGLGDNTRRYSPKQVGADRNWRRVAADGNHTCAINTDGKLFCWGENTYGQLGDSNQPIQPFKTMPGQIGSETNWQNVSVGTHHTCAVKTDHTLWCWGSNDDGQLGVGQPGSRLFIAS